MKVGDLGLIVFISFLAYAFGEEETKDNKLKDTVIPVDDVEVTRLSQFALTKLNEGKTEGEFYNLNQIVVAVKPVHSDIFYRILLNVSASDKQHFCLSEIKEANTSNPLVTFKNCHREVKPSEIVFFNNTKDPLVEEILDFTLSELNKKSNEEFSLFHLKEGLLIDVPRGSLFRMDLTLNHRGEHRNCRVEVLHQLWYDGLLLTCENCTQEGKPEENNYCKSRQI